MRFQIHTPKFLISGGVSVFACTFAVYFWLTRSFVAGAAFLVLGLLYAVIACYLGGMVTIGESGISVLYLFGRKWFIPWLRLQEVGIIGIKVLNNNNTKRTGTKYIYFSEKEMSKDERFQMALEWPPKDVIYLRFDYDRLSVVRKYWKKPIALYNTGRLYIDSPIIE